MKSQSSQNSAVSESGSRTSFEPPFAGTGSTPVPQQDVALKQVICEQATRLAAGQFRETLRALILTGSLARNEATFTEQDGRWRLLGDAEFLLLFHERAPLPSASLLDELGQSVEQSVQQQGLVCSVGFSAVHPTYLRKLEPYIYAYELRACGQVVWGDPQALALIRAFAAAEIPLEDAWRLLCNRMIELLEVAGEVADQPDTLPVRSRYRTLKLYLDMATSFLVFAGAYEPSYRQRADKLLQLAASGQWEDRSPFPLRRFAEQVQACAQMKLNGAEPGGSSPTLAPNDLGCAFWEEAVAHAQLLWRWELACLTGTKPQALNRQLMEMWMRRQPIPTRLRGWLYVVRKLGWLRSLNHWPRWGRRAWQGSPRYWVYAAAGELFFRLPCILRPPRLAVDLDHEEAVSWLPIQHSSAESRALPDWRGLVAAIVFNYEQFLVGTRS